MAAHRTPPQQPQESAEVLRYMQQAYQNQYMLVVQEINNRVALLNELNESEAALKRIAELKGSNTLLDIGAGTYLNSTISKDDGVIVPIGAGYYTVKSSSDAGMQVQKTIDKHKNMLDRLAKNRKQIEEAIMTISYKLNKMSGR